MWFEFCIRTCNNIYKCRAIHMSFLQENLTNLKTMPLREARRIRCSTRWALYRPWWYRTIQAWYRKYRWNNLLWIVKKLVNSLDGYIWFRTVQSTLRKPVVKNLRRALCAQYTFGLMVYYGVSITGYWAYGSEVPDYLPKAISGPKWARVLINSAVFLQNIISQHVCNRFWTTVRLGVFNEPNKS